MMIALSRWLRNLFRPRPHLALLALQETQGAFLAAIESITASNATTLAAIHRMVEHQADASRAQSDAFNTFLQSFQVAAQPIARVMRDDDELRAELERKGFPQTGSPEQQLQWVLKNSGGELDVDDLLHNLM